MTLHKEGTVSIVITTILCAAIGFVTFQFIPFLVIQFILALGIAVLLFLVLWFFRIPLREVVSNSDIVYAPADGKVVVIEETIEAEYFKDKRIQISIFMSPLNVHSNRYPVSGEVTYTKYHKGKYLVAWHPKSSTENERATIVIKMKNGDEVLVRQIAGAVARRIKPYAKKGDKVQQGDELGFIKFGSRVDLFLPLNYKIQCAVDEISRYNVSPIAVIEE